MTDFATMPAGREMDRLVWEILNPGSKDDEPPPLSRNDGMAVNIVIADADRRGWFWRIDNHKGRDEKPVKKIVLHFDGKVLFKHADTMALAICRAFLAACETAKPTDAPTNPKPTGDV